MLLNAGNTDVQKLLGNVAGGVPLTKIGVGTSNTPVLSSDNALTGAVIKAVTGVNLLAGNIVQFTATLDTTDPAMTIQEVGLYNSNNVLCFRKVITARAKTAGVSYVIDYQIKVQ
jgi:tetrahydrodipicolinate N-succinyltransferase